MRTKAKRKRPATSKAKSKLTLSVDSKYVAMLRKAGARRGRSITELVQELAVQLDEAPATGKQLWADRTNGILEGVFKDKDYERTDLVGALLRKHLPRKAKRA